jgi:hypothetical protein
MLTKTSSSTANVLRQRLTYRVDTFDGEDNVAIREVFTLYNDGTPPDTEIGPLAFEVLSLNFLMWNFATASPNWVETWDSGAIPGSLPGAPGAVMAEIIIHGASTRLRLPPARALDGVRLSTIVALENVIQSGSFPRALIADGGDFTSDSFGLYTTDPNGPSPSGRGNSPQIREEILQPGQQSGPRSEVRSP